MGQIDQGALLVAAAFIGEKLQRAGLAAGGEYFLWHGRILHMEHLASVVSNL
jgi:hypothetical protein